MRRARSTMRARRLVSTPRVVPSAVSRKTGATASWMVWVMSWRWLSTGMAARAYARGAPGATPPPAGSGGEAYMSAWSALGRPRPATMA